MTPSLVARLTPLFLIAGLGEASAAAQADVWARVPAFPTGSYQSDGFEKKLGSAQGAVRTDLDRQKAINKELTEKLKTIDPMELASRQTQFMMDHPEEAMKLMQRNAALGETYSDGEVESGEAVLALQRELEEIDARYQSAWDRAYAPIKAKYADLEVRAMKDPLRTEAGDFYKPWATREWNGIAAQENAAYVKFGAEWWAASSPYHGWLKRYREQLAKRIPQREEAENVGAGFMVQLVGSPSATFKPVASLEAVVAYLDQAGRVFARRREGPVQPREVE